MCTVKIESRVFISCFDFKIHKHEEEEKGYVQLLEVVRSKQETIFIVHEFSEKDQVGFFIETYSENTAENIFSLLLSYFSAEEVFRLNEKGEKFKNINIYKNCEKPWFFHPKNKYILNKIFVDDLFVSSI